MRIGLLIFVLFSWFVPCRAWPNDLGKTEINLKNASQENFVLFADEVSRNDQTRTITARGKVQIINEPYTVMADEISYSAEQNLMTARGNVRVMQQAAPDDPPSEVLFTDYLELSDDVVSGLFRNVKMLFSDNSRLVAKDGRRWLNHEQSEITELRDVVYSPCDLCKEDPSQPPLWQMKADRFEHDTDEKQMRYHDATLEFYGIPFFYTPYFSHSDPTAKQEAGILAPQYLNTPFLGNFLRNYYYYPVSENQDLTAELSLASKQGPVLGMEWRQRQAKSKITLSGAITESDLETQTNTRKKMRGYFDLESRMDLNSSWRAGADLKYTGDKTFLKQYKYDGSDILTNRVYAERFLGRSYAAINAYAFQDIRPNKTGDQPNILPLITYQDYGKPGETLGGRWGIEASFMGLTRPYGGQSVQRASASANWHRQWISSLGLKSTVDINSRGDIYGVQAASRDSSGNAREGDNYDVNRFLTSGIWESSLPFVKNGQNRQYTLEPVVAWGMTSRVKNSTVPNEDSQDIELDSSNLFKSSRYPGLDRIEDGQRVTYGLRGGVTELKGGYYDAFVGQSNRLNGNDKFPATSGLSRNRSDVVGQINAMPSQNLDLDYHFRADPNSLAVKRHELSMSTGPKWLRFNTNYAYLREPPATLTDQSHHQIRNTLFTQFAQHWQAFVQDKKDLDHQPKSLLTQAGIKYIDECFTITFSAERNFTKQIGVSTGDSYYVSLGFKNLGNFGSTPFNSLADVPGLMPH